MNKGAAASRQAKPGGEPLRGSGDAQQAWATTTAGTEWPLPQACGADHGHEQGHCGFSGCEHAQYTENTTVSYPHPHAHPAPAVLWRYPDNAEMKTYVSQRSDTLLVTDPAPDSP